MPATRSSEAGLSVSVVEICMALKLDLRSQPVILWAIASPI